DDDPLTSLSHPNIRILQEIDNKIAAMKMLDSTPVLLKDAKQHMTNATGMDKRVTSKVSKKLNFSVRDSIYSPSKKLVSLKFAPEKLIDKKIKQTKLVKLKKNSTCR
ncbi:MAG: hypothetical protein MHPSP_004875, partial [Paramarteilia canceri]